MTSGFRQIVYGWGKELRKTNGWHHHICLSDYGFFTARFLFWFYFVSLAHTNVHKNQRIGYGTGSV